MPGSSYVIMREYDEEASIASRGNGFVHLFTLIWMVGVILFDKWFAYISIGPIYITELLLVTLMIANFWRITTRDYLLLAVLAFYVIGGLQRGYVPFFVIKDISFFYYLLFLRFFPKDFPAKYVDIVIATCFLRLVLLLASPLVDNSTLYSFGNKYRDGVVVLFLAGVFCQRSKTGIIGFAGACFLGFCSYITDYKALMFAMFILPVLLIVRHPLAKVMTPKRLVFAVFLFIYVVYSGGASYLLTTGVDSLNLLLKATSSARNYDNGTAIWRAEIWSHALMRLNTPMRFLFGEFPGHNFIDSKYLGIKSFFLQGGDALGILRSAHNILVQMVMKTGCAGILFYGYFYFSYSDKNQTVLNVLKLIALILAMTADIFEVPSRGPLLFCFFSILESGRLRVDRTSQALSQQLSNSIQTDTLILVKNENQ